MEIEAKYRIADLGRFAQLRQLRSLDDYELTPLSDMLLTDRYLDTPDRQIWEAGYAFRMREGAHGTRATLKGRGGAEGSVHRREEYEADVPSGIAPAGWPDSGLKKRVLRLIGDAPLSEIVVLRQRRERRSITQSGRAVGELCLDEIEFSPGGTRYVLEIELAESGLDNDLHVLDRELRPFGLTDEPRSKLEIGMEFDTSGHDTAFQLSDQERHDLDAIAADADPAIAKRARMILLAADGARSVTIGQRLGVSDSYVRRWLRHFRRDGMRLFLSEQSQAPEPTTEGSSRGNESNSVDTVSPVPSAASSTAPLPPGLERLSERFSVDRGHADRVRDLALALFDKFPDVHRISPYRRPLLEAAAEIHALGTSLDPDHAQTVGRDLLAGETIEGMGPEDRNMVACMIRFQRKRVEPAEEPLLLTMSEENRRETLGLSAILRIAASLGDEGPSASRVAVVEWRDGVATVFLEGEAAAQDARRARKRSDLWHDLFPFPVDVRAAETESQQADDGRRRKSAPADPEPDVPPAATGREPGITAGDRMVEAARKIMATHFRKLLENEEGTLDGRDIEALHDMRVATRRLRAACDVFGPYLSPRRLTPVRESLRKCGRALGPVRDLDVLLEDLDRYSRTLDTETRERLVPLEEAWRADREAARARMTRFLSSRAYSALQESIDALLRSPAAGREDPLAIGETVSAVAPGLIWNRMGRVLAYAPLIPDAPIERLHELRIDGKRLRYTLEFFKDPLGKAGEKAVEVVTRAQDLLGGLHDDDVAANLTRRFLAHRTRYAYSHGVSLGSLDAFTGYLSHREARLADGLSGVGKMWQSLSGRDLIDLINAAIARLF